MMCPQCGKGDVHDPDPEWPGCPMCNPDIEEWGRDGYCTYGWELYPSCAIANRSDYI